jgi:hypothetical protein
MNVGEKTTTDSIAAMMEQLKVFSDDNFGKPERGPVFKLLLFKEFAAKHLTLTDYGVQVLKCENVSCKFHQPLRMTPAEFDAIPLIPAPILDEMNQHYLKLDATLTRDPTGKPDDSHLSSLIKRKRLAAAKARSKATPRTTRSSTLTGVKPIAGPIGVAVVCIDCDKPRVIYTQNSLDRSTLAGLIDDLDQEMFVCGGPVLRDDHALVKTVATLSGLTCNQAINSAYYSTYKVLAKKHNLPEFVDLRCFSCASIDTDVQRRKPEPLGTYEFILPTCTTCHDAGEHHFRLSNKRAKPAGEKHVAKSKKKARQQVSSSDDSSSGDASSE